MKSLPRQTATSVIDFLQGHDGAAGLLPAARRMVRLRQDFVALLPVPLRETCEVSGFDDETVTLRVSSAGVAAKLRQTVPRLRDGLLDRGWQVSAIRIRVQPRGSVVPSTSWKASSQTTIPDGGITAFRELNAVLDDSPLKAAVERLIRRRPAPR